MFLVYLFFCKFKKNLYFYTIIYNVFLIIIKFLFMTQQNNNISTLETLERLKWLDPEVDEIEISFSLNLAINYIEKKLNWILENSHQLEQQEIEEKVKKIFWMFEDIQIRAFMLESLFKDFSKNNKDLNLWDIRDIDSSEYYHFRPLVGIFYKWKPIFLNQNYVQWLWAESLSQLKEDIENGVVYEKYYEEWSDELAKEHVSKLKKWEWYKNLVLITKSWRIISFNSFWSIDWLEIRIWEDITNWRLNENEKNQNSENENEFELKTDLLINEFKSQVNDLVKLPEKINSIFETFWYISKILDTIWNDWQFLMNYTVQKWDNPKKIVYNKKYHSALPDKSKSWDFSQTYWVEKANEIESYINMWKTYGYYVEHFTMWDKVYWWLRAVLSNKAKKDTTISFWMWTDVISNEDQYILEQLKKDNLS